VLSIERLVGGAGASSALQDDAGAAALQAAVSQAGVARTCCRAVAGRRTALAAEVTSSFSQPLFLAVISRCRRRLHGRRVSLILLRQFTQPLARTNVHVLQ